MEPKVVAERRDYRNKKRRNVNIPKVKELWLLWNVDSKDWAVAFDDPTPEVAYLWAKNKQAAIALQEHQKELYDVKSVPIRVI